MSLCACYRVFRTTDQKPFNECVIIQQVTNGQREIRRDISHVLLRSTIITLIAVGLQGSQNCTVSRSAQQMHRNN